MGRDLQSRKSFTIDLVPRAAAFGERHVAHQYQADDHDNNFASEMPALYRPLVHADLVEVSISESERFSISAITGTTFAFSCGS